MTTAERDSKPFTVVLQRLKQRPIYQTFRGFGLWRTGEPARLSLLRAQRFDVSRSFAALRSHVNVGEWITVTTPSTFFPNGQTVLCDL